MINTIDFGTLEKKEVYIFGAGRIGRLLANELESKGIEICGFLDNDRSKEGKLILDRFPIIPPEEFNFIYEAKPADTVLITAVLKYEKVLEQIARVIPSLENSSLFVSLSWRCPYPEDNDKCGYGDLLYDGRPFDDFSSDEVREMLADEDSRTLYDFVLEIDDEEVYIFSCEDIAHIRSKSEYWEDLPESCQFRHGEEVAILDCGAYRGDSVLQICHEISPARCTYYAFEPDEEVWEDLILSENSLNNARAAKNMAPVEFKNIAKGVWLKNAALDFNYYTDSASSSIEVNRNLEGSEKGEIGTLAIDSLDIRAPEVFIKMDIEGSEAAAIRGAEKLISQKKAHLAVCAYHRPKDLVILPLLLKAMNPNYSIYFRGGMHYTFYAVPK